MKQGWVWKSKEYGTWFISKESVTKHWQEDRLELYGELRDPTKEQLDLWHDEQITWVEVSLLGEHIGDPDMNYWKEVFLQRMKTDYDRDFDAKEVNNEN